MSIESNASFQNAPGWYRSETFSDLAFVSIIMSLEVSCIITSKSSYIFYIQYAVARINSLNKFFKEKQLKLLDFNQKLFDRFDENEIALLKALSLWPKVIENSVIYKEPHRIVYYLIDLAGAFHNYWSKGNLDSKMRVINEADIELTVARLTLLNCISKVIKLGLDILAIKPVEKM